MGSPQYFLYIGTYTRGDQSQGIYRHHFDGTTGHLSEGELAATTINPTFLTLSPDGQHLYAINEVGTFEGAPGGGVSAYRIGHDSGELTPLNTQEVGSAGSCHLAIDQTGKVLVVANYSGGSVASFPLRDDGSIGPRVSLHQHTGQGPHERRQTKPHAHGTTISPCNDYVLVPDLGTDTVFIYRIDHQTAELTPHGETRMAPAAGPRHVTFSHDGKQAYVINELDNTITKGKWDASTGTLQAEDSYPTLPTDFSGENTTAEIILHQNDRFLYGSNRGHDSLVLFHRDSEAGTLQLEGHFPAGGQNPRHFDLSPDGQWLIAAHQNSNSLTAFSVDQETGHLSAVSTTSTPLPVCVVFVPQVSP